MNEKSARRKMKRIERDCRHFSSHSFLKFNKMNAFCPCGDAQQYYKCVVCNPGLNQITESSTYA
ncbi:MAG: hypothetical protein NTX25_03540, partial [Proteobacteria bacterium]|nr:hypothetical protein [Pseudomonadota bacterium]